MCVQSSKAEGREFMAVPRLTQVFGAGMETQKRTRCVYLYRIQIRTPKCKRRDDPRQVARTRLCYLDKPWMRSSQG